MAWQYFTVDRLLNSPPRQQPAFVSKTNPPPIAPAQPTGNGGVKDFLADIDADEEMEYFKRLAEGG
jgi:hypothetical protein